MTSEALGRDFSTVDDEALAELLYRIVGERVREMREDDLTQEELANEVGIGRTSVTNLERGRQRVPLHHLLRIADVLEVPLSNLVPSWEELRQEYEGQLLDGRPATERFVREHLKGED